MDADIYYKKKLQLLIENIILYVSDISKILEKNLVEFTEPVGFSISAVSRIRKKVKESPESTLENLPYALCMLTSLDSIYLFEGITIDTRSEIEKILLDNLCDTVFLFHDADNKPITTRDFESQSWFKIDYTAGRGFTYQVQFFLHEISKMKEGKELQVIQGELFQKLQVAKVAFTGKGLKILEKNFIEIKDSLETIYRNEFMQKNRAYISSVTRDEIYFGTIPSDLSCNLEVCSLNWDNTQDIPHNLKDFIEIVDFCFKEDSCILLFIQDEDNMRRYLPILDILYKEYNNKIIFAYNRYFENLGYFKIVFHYKNTLVDMKFEDGLSKYMNLNLGGINYGK